MPQTSTAHSHTPDRLNQILQLARRQHRNKHAPSRYIDQSTEKQSKVSKPRVTHDPRPVLTAYTNRISSVSFVILSVRDRKAKVMLTPTSTDDY
jgi:hypothetical protein